MLINNRYPPISPAAFREGDIVDAEVTFMLVPIRNDLHKLVAVLRSLTLLDATYTQVSQKAKNRPHC
jgi:hypothetical protein